MVEIVVYRTPAVVGMRTPSTSTMDSSDILQPVSDWCTGIEPSTRHSATYELMNRNMVAEIASPLVATSCMECPCCLR